MLTVEEGAEAGQMKITEKVFEGSCTFETTLPKTDFEEGVCDITKKITAAADDVLAYKAYDETS